MKQNYNKKCGMAVDYTTCLPRNTEQLYKIIRFRFEGSSKVRKRNLTLAEAQAHCQREDTRGKGWLDGYEKE